MLALVHSPPPPPYIFSNRTVLSTKLEKINPMTLGNRTFLAGSCDPVHGCFRDMHGCYVEVEHLYVCHRVATLTRPGSVQSSVQMEMIQQFSDFVVPLRGVFPEPPSNVGTLQSYLHNQSLVLHGPEYKTLKHIPKVGTCFSIGILLYLGFTQLHLYGHGTRLQQ